MIDKKSIEVSSESVCATSTTKNSIIFLIMSPGITGWWASCIKNGFKGVICNG